MSVNFRLKTSKIIGQRKAFYAENSSVQSLAVQGKKLLTSRNGDRKIMQSIKIMSAPPSSKRKWNQLSQFWRTSTKAILIEKT